MKSILSQLLFEPVVMPRTSGRQVKFDADVPDIMVSTGPLEERITRLLHMRDCPMTVREIARGIDSNASQVNKGLRSLLSRCKVEIIEMPGCVNEYVLK